MNIENKASNIAKAVWDAPTIEEIDYAETEAAYGIPGAVDFGIYTN